MDGGSGAAAGNHVTPEAATSGVSMGVTTQCTRWRFSTSTRSCTAVPGPGSAQLDLAVREEHRARRGRRPAPLQPAQVAEGLVGQPSLELGLEPKEIARSAPAGLRADRCATRTVPAYFVRSIT